MENIKNKPHTKKIPKARKMAKKGKEEWAPRGGIDWTPDELVKTYELYLKGYENKDIGKHLGRTDMSVRLVTQKARDEGKIPKRAPGRRRGLDPLPVFVEEGASLPVAAAGNIPSPAPSAGPSNTAPSSQSPAVSSGSAPAGASGVSNPHAGFHPGPVPENSWRRPWAPINAQAQVTASPSDAVSAAAPASAAPSPLAGASASPPAAASSSAAADASSPAPASALASPPADDSLRALEVNAVRTLASGFTRFTTGDTWGDMSIVPVHLPRPAPPMEALYGGSSFTRTPLPGYDQVVLENCAQVAHRKAGRLPDPQNRFH
ncbi:hypothetical protein PRZ48_005457 [Zasmidium cellare]|uniref:Uncharacterized protein n=1 Tax=Zasmidium cellare TaxID=395010 RepID=A0ABR0ESF8_ZASCE|nr:hypothetical protein PRZ48_005457 [Zasmidium cellare]